MRRFQNAFTVSAVVLGLALLQEFAQAATPAPTRAPTDDKVGTAFAPTIPGGLCTNDEDYGKWTTAVSASDSRTGFDLFPSELQTCTTSCPLTSTGGNADYECGVALETNPCEVDLSARCVKDCMSGTPAPSPSARPFPDLTVRFSVPCAGCMGNLSYCGLTKCATSCVQGGFLNEACRDCNVEKCNPAFLLCAGIDPTIKSSPSLNTLPILIGAVVGGGSLLAFVIIFGTWYRQRTKKSKFTPEELAILASSQSPMSGGFQVGSTNLSQISSGKIADMGSPTSNPVYKGSPSPGMYPASPASSSSAGSGLTPYQQQYMAQQQALAQGRISLDPTQSRVAPSVRASAMVQRAVSNAPSVTASATPLVVLYDFNAEREDELTAAVGDKMLGIEQQDGWWLAQTSKGVMGLIPVAYTAVDSDPGPAPTGSRFNPDF